jgi:hypothetical protein
VPALREHRQGGGLKRPLTGTSVAARRRAGVSFFGGNLYKYQTVSGAAGRTFQQKERFRLRQSSPTRSLDQEKT